MENLSYTKINEFNASNSLLGHSFESDLNYLASAIDSNKLEVDKDLILEQFKYCYELYKGRNRFSNYPAYLHPLSVALIIIEELQVNDTATIVAALMHDIIIDFDEFDINAVHDRFPDDIADLIIEVTNISHTGQHAEIQKNQAEIYRKLFLSIVKDLRIFIIKLADRLHNLRMINYFQPERQKKLAEDTLDFFTPFAHRLGLQKLKTELETRSFYFLNGTQYNQILEFLAVRKKSFSEYLFLFLDSLKNCLDEAGIKYHLKTVQKQAYEIFSLLKDGKKLEDISDLFAMVIVLETEDENECSNTYNILLNKFNSFNFFDYISNPVFDLYHSLKTKLHNINGDVELIIRTEKMENYAENGFLPYLTKKNTAETSYELLKISEEEAELWGNWMQSMIETKGKQAPQIIWDTIKNNVFEKEITVYTKNNVPVKLPKDSTLIDFAFAVSYEMGMHVITGKVNNTIKDIFSRLEDGDLVEVITSAKCNPESNWLNNVVSFKAICHLHEYFKSNIHYKLKRGRKKEIKADYAVKLINIVGVDRNGMVNDIQAQLGADKILRIRLAHYVNEFEAVVEIKTQLDENINIYFAKLFNIKGIKSVSIA